MAVIIGWQGSLNIGQFKIFPFLENSSVSSRYHHYWEFETIFMPDIFFLLPLNSVIPQCSFKVRVHFGNLAPTGGPTLSHAVKGSSMSSKMSASESCSVTDWVCSNKSLKSLIYHEVYFYPKVRSHCFCHFCQGSSKSCHSGISLVGMPYTKMPLPYFGGLQTIYSCFYLSV